MIRKKQKISVVLVALVLIVGVILYAIMRPSGSPATKPTVTFEQDGTRTDSSDASSADQDDTIHSDTSTTDQQPTNITPKNDATNPASRTVTKSPKQDAIRDSVDVEYTYYPLRTANDPSYPNNWAVQRVNAPAAWDITTGNNQTTIAVIDSGFALNHEDLKDNWHLNTNEQGLTQIGDVCWTGISQQKSTNNCDDDGNGYIDDWRGWNFSIGDNNPMAGRTNATGAGVSHGTETAGLAGAKGNNLTGTTTINWDTKIMPLQALSDDGPGFTSDIAAAIYYAIDNGADVINMSLGGSAYDPALKQATDYAYSRDVVVVAASGNCGTGNEGGCAGLAPGAMGYPALNDHVIAVGATDFNNQRASFSSYGPTLDIVAPGSGSIVSPTWTASNTTSLYAAQLYGTSYASPQVASLASLIKSIRPSSSADDVAALLLASATKLPSMNGLAYTESVGHGIINAEAALRIATSLNTTTATPELLQAGGVRTEHSYTTTDKLGSGCESAIDTYCTVWMRHAQSGKERYLPYTKITSTNPVGWSWNGDLLKSGLWEIRAAQGHAYSSPYLLGEK